MTKSVKASNGGGDNPVADRDRERLIGASPLPDGRIRVRFADQFEGIVNLADLELDLALLKMETVRASSWGSAAEVDDLNMRPVHIDSSVLRAHIDPNFAADLQKAIVNSSSR